MLNCILNFFYKNQNQNQPKNDLFNKEYRSAYNRLWIQKLNKYP